MNSEKLTENLKFGSVSMKMLKLCKIFGGGIRSRVGLLYSTEAPVQQKIKQIVENNKVVVFMKGVPEQPMCGFSNAVVQVLRMHGATYDAHNVLEDEEIRQGIKEFSDWPTIPQVFIGGEFVGGCDILIQLHQSGELIEELKKVGIKSALLEKAEQDLEKDEKK